MKLDPFDVKILTALQNDGVMTNDALSDFVGLSGSQCSRRRLALEKSGIIEKYTAQLDRGKLGFKLHVFIRVSLRAQTKNDHLEFSVWVRQQAQVKSAFSVSGDADYLLEVYTRDLDEFSDFLHENLLPQTQVVSVRSEFVLKNLKHHSMLAL